MSNIALVLRSGWIATEYAANSLYLNGSFMPFFNCHCITPSICSLNILSFANKTPRLIPTAFITHHPQQNLRRRLFYLLSFPLLIFNQSNIKLHEVWEEIEATNPGDAARMARQIRVLQGFEETCKVNFCGSSNEERIARVWESRGRVCLLFEQWDWEVECIFHGTRGGFRYPA